MKILSITLEKCSGCAIMIGDKIIFSSSEERYTRIKSDSSFPRKSIEAALKFSGLKGSDLDKVLICSTEVSLYASLLNLYSSQSVSDQLHMMKNYWEPKLVNNKKVNFLYFLKDKIQYHRYPFNTKFAKRFKFLNKNFKIKINQNDEKKPYQSDKNIKEISNFFKDVISDYLNIDKSIIQHVDHHTCHAAYALHASPLRKNKTMIVTADAFGDYLSGSISLYNKSLQRIKRLKAYSHKNFQIARIYRFTTLYLKMLADSHEYKVMGLAPYYTGPMREKVETVFLKIQTIKGIEFIFNKKIKNIYYFLENNLKKFRFDHISAGLQQFTERLLVTWFKNLIKKFKVRNVVFSGGTSMNVKANMEISKIKGLKNIFICGSGTDDTLPIGACYYWAEKSNIKTTPLKDMYLGTEANYSLKDLKTFSKYSIKKITKPDQVLNTLLKHQIIAVCRGRAEMGQRSLGNRSILADPRKIENVTKINKAIKQRDFWMPFAPVILEKYQKILINNPKKIKSPYMTMAFETKVIAEKYIPAAIHQADKTARAQLLERNANKDLWDLINLFYKKTKVPALLNTSFNLHGFPIVNNIYDAKIVFERSELTALWLNNHLIEKKI
jgi:carbamoyltransferase